MTRTPIICLLIISLATVPPPVMGQLSSDVVFDSGNIKVLRSVHYDEAGTPFRLHSLLRGGDFIGENFVDTTHRRMPLAFHHSRSPVGVMLEQFNWFPGLANTYHADVRIAASLVGNFGVGSLPIGQLVALWSEPPIGVIGLGRVGTSAAYARPFQHVDFYEPAKHAIDLMDRTESRLFYYIADARDRGAQIRIIHGSPRQQLVALGPRHFYRLMVVESCTGENGEKIFLDLFTKEGIAQCMEHLTDEGILCINTSHRFLRLPEILAKIASQSNLTIRVGQDVAPDTRKTPSLAEIRHFASEWVMLSRDKNALDAACRIPLGYKELVQKHSKWAERVEFWSTPRPSAQLWTDKGPNLLHGVLRGHPSMRYCYGVQWTIVERIADAVKVLGFDGVTPSEVQRWMGMPDFVEEFLVFQQLQTNPRVETLWP